MNQLPNLTPLPENISEIVLSLIHTPQQPDGLGEWLLDLIKASGHLSMTDDLRWRLLCMVWLATEFETETVWPYLMWFNQHEETMGDHLHEMLFEAVNDYACHIELAGWLAHAQDARVKKFFEGYQNIPSQTRLPNLLRRLLPRATDPTVGLWLKSYLELLASDNSTHLRPWRLLLAVWYGTCFQAEFGLQQLFLLTDNKATLKLSDNKLLADTADEINATPHLIQWLAACDNPTLKEMFAEFGHPNLEIFIETIFQKPPDFSHLKGSESHAATDARTARRYMELLRLTGISPNAPLLDMACGSLAPLTLQLSTAGYSNLIGVDLQIPPAYWPVGFVQRLTRSKYVKAWQTITESYYTTLTRESNLKLNWKALTIELADLTRLHFSDNSFEAVLCSHYLHHAPDVSGLLAEAARVLKPNGILIADIRPYPSLTGAYLPPEAEPAWAHLRSHEVIAPPHTILNQWREEQYQTALRQFFTLEQWIPSTDEAAQKRLTPAIQAELAAYSEAELTRYDIIFVGRKQ